MSVETPPLPAGARLGSYEIKEQIGKGDTGDVYRAWDASRKRDIALKRLPAGLSTSPAPVARFLHSIDILAGLSHRSIAALYGFEEIGDQRLITMELTEGQLLSARLSKGPLQVDEAIPIITQVAEAIEYAHRRRLIHGHLHPSNVKIDGTGVVKIYDFGLTRAIEMLEMDDSVLGQKATVEHPGIWHGSATRDSTYMSPEQMQGKVDERTDLWAMGVLLWEMLAGTNPFERPTISETSKAVLKDDPDWSSLPFAVPPNVLRVLQLSLQKRPSMRLRNAGDFVVEISIPFR